MPDVAATGPCSHTRTACTAMQACFVAQGVELFRAMVAASGIPCQRAYTAVISTLLRIKRRGLANKRCVCACFSSSG